MIIVKLQGGLGNQMFQYAFGRALSLRTGDAVYYDRLWYEFPSDGDTVRPYELDIFSLPLLFAKERDIPLGQRPVRSGYESFRNALLQRIPLLRSISGAFRFTTALDLCQGVQKDLLNIRADKNVYLCGYWQSEKYFEDASSAIRKDFSFRDLPDQENQAVLDQMAADVAHGFVPVSLHIRRGDYSSNPRTKAFHGVLPFSYYEKAMAILERQFPRISYYIFSDDLGWCRENLRFNGRAEFVGANTDKPAWMDMRLMSACRHHIIANSSFSWWGAWLNADQDKIVIAPKQWRADPGFIGKDLLPDNWIKV